MAEVNLLARYPKAKRNVKARLGNKEENRPFSASIRATILSTVGTS